jgi:hypothetical protein
VAAVPNHDERAETHTNIFLIENNADVATISMSPQMLPVHFDYFFDSVFDPSYTYEGDEIERDVLNIL